MKLSNAAVASRYFLSKRTIGVQMYCVFSLSAIYCVVVLLVGAFLDGKVLCESFGFRQISKYVGPYDEHVHRVIIQQHFIIITGS